MLKGAFDVIFRRMPEAVWLLSTDGVVIAANPAAAEALGQSSADQSSRQFAAFLDGPSGRFLSQLEKARRAERLDGLRISLRTTKGTRESMAEITRVDSGEQAGFILRCDLNKWAARQLTQISQHLDILQKNLLEQKRREFALLSKARDADIDRKRFQTQALRDSLTNLPNRRAFKRQLLDLWDMCKQDNLPLAELMVDIDQFKLYNDHFGHPAGDRCLAAVGSALGDALHRDQDFVARLGGEEFAILLPDCNLDGGATVAERLRASVAAREIEHAPEAISDSVTVSIGCAVGHPCAGIDSAVLSHLADELLYQAKQGGRNRVRVGAIESDWSGVVPVLQSGPNLSADTED